MKIEDVSGVEALAYHGADGEGKFYLLPNEEVVEQIVAKLCEEGISDTIQLSLSRNQAEPAHKQQGPLLEDMVSHLQGMKVAPSISSVDPGIEEVLGKEYLAIDGEQKVYVLPENVPVEELLGNFKSLRTGEVKQSQMWRKTDVPVNSHVEKAIIAAMEKRIQRLEVLLNQKTAEEADKEEQDNK